MTPLEKGRNVADKIEKRVWALHGFTRVVEPMIVYDEPFPRYEERIIGPKIGEAVVDVVSLDWHEQEMERLQAELEMKSRLRSADCRYIEQLAEEIQSLKAQLEIVEKAISEVESWYPTSVFPEDGISLDCKSAFMARKTCANIREQIKAMRSKND